MIGKEILNYIITSYIGKGGMGTVYLAENKYIKQQKVAVKVINANMVNQTTKDSLTEEAKKLASLNHNNIVHFINYHIDEEGNIYLIMEYAGGMSLEKYINTKTGLIVEENICKLFEPILDAVGTAHKQGIIHRDLKPSNIIIGDDGTPKVLDFGISTLMGLNVNNNAQVMGTPSFMSPEQVKGEPLDARSDIYSLGVILHQMLTGKAPYDITTMTAFEINKKVVEEKLPRMQTYYKYISEKLQKVVDKATAKDPKDRYNTCAEFKSALHNAIYPPKLPKWAIISIAATVAILLGCGFYYWDYNRTKVYYYKDYVEQWGVPQGIGKLSSNQAKHACRMYRMEYSKRLLQRMSHVNSLDKLINDGESERIERPIDAWFYYTEDKKLSSVKEKDMHGKTLHVKSYNDKLNTVIFKYDDEYGTEKTLGASSIGYTNALTNEYVKKGRISRWLIEYDENGYVKTMRYAGFQNVAVGDENGIYGRTYVRDDKGRVVEEHYLGKDGLAKATKWGLGIKKFYYDENDNWVKAEYLTVNGDPAYDAADGISIYTIKYDTYGNLTEARYCEGNGELMIPKMNGIAGVNFVYNDKGFKIKEEVVGLDGNPMQNNGFSSVVSEYDNNGYVSNNTYFDLEGEKCLFRGGCASVSYVNDENGNQLEQSYYDIDGKLVMCDEGYAAVKAKYDDNGNMIQVVYYDTENNPIVNNDGYAGCSTEYDDYGRDVKDTYLDEDLKPTISKSGMSIVIREYAKNGNLTKISFYDQLEKKLVLSEEEIAGWKSKYDDNGNEVEREFFDTQENPCLLNGHDYAKVKYEYDEFGNETKVRYCGLDGEYTLYRGIIGTDYVLDERGNILENKAVGLDGNLASGRLYVKYVYDKYDNILENSVYDSDKKPAINALSVHKMTFSYDERNQIVELKCYDVDGKLTLYVNSDDDFDNYAIIKNEYDKNGRLIMISVFGTDEKPCKCSGKWSSKKMEYDACGNVVRELFYDESVKPTNPDDKIPECVKEFDKFGNNTSLTYCDGNGNRIVSKNGICITKYEYDNDKNIIKESYFDDEEKPVYYDEKCHSIAYEYDKYGNKCAIRYYGNDDEAIYYLDRYHLIRFIYERDKEVEESYYDVKEEPILYMGLHRLVTLYDEKDRWAGHECYDVDGIITDSDYGFARMEVYQDDNGGGTKKEFNARGELILAAKWVDGQWVRVNSNKWISEVKEIDASLPITKEFTVGEVTCEITVYNINIIDRAKHTCQVIMRTNVNSYDIGEENYEELIIGFMNDFSLELKKILSSNVTINGVLIDRNEKQTLRAY